MHIKSLAFMVVAACAYSAAVLAQPKLTVEQEWKAHPNLVKAVHAMEEAINDLNKAPHDFDGNRVRAVNDLKAAIHSLKKAILYRLKMDDAAIDRAQAH